MLSHLYLVEVEGKLPRDRAVQPGLEEGGPAALVLVGTAAVALAHPRDAGEHGLK